MSAAYDFQTLSPEDFERLSRDLLSAEWGKPFEIFKSGRDKGIDLRYSKPSDGEKIVVQCKRYSPDGFARLKKVLTSSEIPKVQKLNPTRYILMTSVPLTVGQKDELFELLQPWCKSADDIFGANEINALLSQHPKVQRAHFKLWLSSTVMMERILHSGIWNRTVATIEEIRKELCRFVIHDGLYQAAEILEEQKHCIIVGIPGIGKTTLAKILLYQYINNDYEAVVVSGDVEEAWKVATEALVDNKKLVILYDDFLGQISFEHRKFAKNEEHRFLSLLKAVKNSKNIRFILTTREYILADAKRHHAALAAAETFLEKFTLTLGHYTLTNRARILFNHIFFSDLPQSRVQAIVENKVYKTIISHKNYNPRIVSSITEHARFKLCDDAEYIERISREFNDPSHVWDHAFRNDIQPNSRTLLYILWSFGEQAAITALKSAFFNVVNDAFDGTQNDLFDRSIKELDGNFISSDRFSYLGQHEDFEICIKFQNPSIRDYLDSRVNSDSTLLRKLCATCVRFTQVARLFDHRNKISGSMKNDFLNCLHSSAIQGLEEEDESIIYFAGEPRLSRTRAKNIADRLCLIVQIGDEIGASIKTLETIEPWISSSEKLQKVIDNSSFYTTTRLISVLLNTSILDGFHRKRFLDALERTIAACLDNASWVSEVQDIVAFLHKYDYLNLKIPKSMLISQLIQVVHQVQETAKYNDLTAPDLEDERSALDHCRRLLGDNFSQQFLILDQLIEDAGERENEEEPAEVAIPKRNAYDPEVEIDGLFSELLIH